MEDVKNASIKKVDRICRAIMKLTDEDFTAVEEMAAEQQAYMHPLKYATAARINDLGDHNKRMAKGLRIMKKQIELSKARTK
ncbi:MAG TPA: hypothetical protein VL727_29215 [Puia sp.]|jgi:hypothetical protein|nr:hypothetical protein [Puia sp.]